MVSPFDTAWLVLKNTDKGAYYEEPPSTYHPAIMGLMNRKYTQEAFNEGDPGTGEWGRNDFQAELEGVDAQSSPNLISTMALDERGSQYQPIPRIQRQSINPAGLPWSPPEPSIDDEMRMEEQAEREYLADKGRDNPDMTHEKYDFADERHDNPEWFYNLDHEFPGSVYPGGEYPTDVYGRPI
tara:strand:- start:616 stop:1164 length:549 start_codon:yes stop_codon:yes gene_type:complete